MVTNKSINVDKAIKEAIQCMISYNDNHDYLDQIFICPGSINKFCSDKEKAKSFNLEPCTFGEEARVRALKVIADIIDEHHKKHNLNSTHNLRMGNLKRLSKKSSREPPYRDSLSHHRTSDVAYGGFAVMFTKS